MNFDTFKPITRSMLLASALACTQQSGKEANTAPRTPAAEDHSAPTPAASESAATKPSAAAGEGEVKRYGMYEGTSEKRKIILALTGSGGAILRSRPAGATAAEQSMKQRGKWSESADGTITVELEAPEGASEGTTTMVFKTDSSGSFIAHDWDKDVYGEGGFTLAKSI